MRHSYADSSARHGDGGAAKECFAKRAIQWHQLTPQEAMRRLEVGEAGLTGNEAARRLANFGANELPDTGARSRWAIMWEQLTSLLVLMLIGAAAVSFALRDYGEAAAIAVIVVLNALLGFSQEYRAEKAILGLKKLAVPIAKVRRNGEIQRVPAVSLVPGDILLLETGDIVPADCRVVRSVSLSVQEAALTGESQPVEKTEEAIEPGDTPLAERRNLVYMGTFITAGRGLALITETGTRSELGKIAGMIRSIGREATPLQNRLAGLAKRLGAAALLIVSLIFLLGVARGESLGLMFLTAVSIAVAAVPEGLPAVVTIVLTLGARRMLRKKALIRKLGAVETLGSVTTICADKTGTLTQNQMAVEVLYIPDQAVQLERPNPGEADSASPGSLPGGVQLLLAGAAVCNDVALTAISREKASATPLGDPTEVALVTVARHFGLNKTELEPILPRVAEVPFSSERKFMTTFHTWKEHRQSLPLELQSSIGDASSTYLAFTKGSVEALLDLSSLVRVGNKNENLGQGWQSRLLAANNDLASKGMRVIGVAFRQCVSVPTNCRNDGTERDFTFLGMLGLADPPRPEVASAVATCQSAGIRPLMITGDHPLTAQHIAARIGLQGSGRVLTGPELDRTAKDELGRLVRSTSVYARVSPEHKLDIVKALQGDGQIVAMTGDGVNDAPALKRADVGIAMGVSGTAVAKQAADMVLLDDNFATIVSAVDEGRVIYDNIRKFVRYILATNSGEIWVMLLAPLWGMPLPLLPMQILWMNLVTDGLPALALSVEPAEDDTMHRPPRPPGESIFARGLGRHVIWVGMLMGLLSLSVAKWYWNANDPKWQTMVFTTLTLAQMAHVMAIRSERRSLFEIGVLSNKPLLGSVVLTVLLQSAIVYTPSLQRVFTTKPLWISEVALCLVPSMVIFVAVEGEKWLARR